MSDTTNTITPEMRKMFREDATFILAHEKKNLERIGAAEAILRLLNVLKASEDEVAQLRKECDWLAVELGNALIDPCLVEHLRDLGGMSPPDPKTLREVARRAVTAGEE